MTWETIRNLIRDEWVILSLLFFWSLAGLTVICERVYALWNVLGKSEAFKDKVIAALEGGDLAKASALCETSAAPLAEVYERGLKVFQKTPQKTADAVASQRARLHPPIAISQPPIRRTTAHKGRNDTGHPWSRRVGGVGQWARSSSLRR